jgi:hypothetical protein
MQTGRNRLSIQRLVSAGVACQLLALLRHGELLKRGPLFGLEAAISAPARTAARVAAFFAMITGPRPSREITDRKQFDTTRALILLYGYQCQDIDRADYELPDAHGVALRVLCAPGAIEYTLRYHDDDKSWTVVPKEAP